MSDEGGVTLSEVVPDITLARVTPGPGKGALGTWRPPGGPRTRAGISRPATQGGARRDTHADGADGVGTPGRGDNGAPMAVADAAPSERGAVQIDAVIACLQDRGGLEPTVRLPSAVEAAAAEEDEEEGPATDALAAIDKFLCSACHDLEGSEADIGPDLRGIAGRMSREQIMAAILDPNAEIAEGYEADLMPADLSEQMYVSELTLIADYLAGLSE